MLKRLVRMGWECSPEKLKTPINIQRVKKYWNDTGCIFIHVPKAAGTSISYALYGRDLGHFTAEEVRRYALFKYSSLYRFAVIRNPWDRVLSAYKFAKVGRTESMGVSNPQKYQIPEFATFERFIVDWLSKQNVRKLDYIFRPQTDFVCDRGGELMVDYVGRVEKLAECSEKISSVIGKELAIGRMNATRKDNEPYHAAYTSKEMIRIVEEIYNKDVEKFEYKFTC